MQLTRTFAPFALEEQTKEPEAQRWMAQSSGKPASVSTQFPHVQESMEYTGSRPDLSTASPYFFFTDSCVPGH